MFNKEQRKFQRSTESGNKVLTVLTASVFRTERAK